MSTDTKDGAEYRLVLCPHQGGIARSAYQNVYRMLFENLERLMEGKRPERIVNGL